MVTRGGGAGLPLTMRGISCGTSELLPIGVASRSCGGAGRFAGRGWICGGAAWLAGTGLPLTRGRVLGDGGIPSVNLGFGALLLLRFLPGTGGRRRGTGAAAVEEDILLLSTRLFCLSPGKNNSLGSAAVARSAVLLEDTLAMVFWDND